MAGAGPGGPGALGGWHNADIPEPYPEPEAGAEKHRQRMRADSFFFLLNFNKIDFDPSYESITKLIYLVLFRVLCSFCCLFVCLFVCFETGFLFVALAVPEHIM